MASSLGKSLTFCVRNSRYFQQKNYVSRFSVSASALSAHGNGVKFGRGLIRWQVATLVIRPFMMMMTMKMLMTWLYVLFGRLWIVNVNLTFYFDRIELSFGSETRQIRSGASVLEERRPEDSLPRHGIRRRTFQQPK